MATVPERLYRNAAGDLVGQGDPDAAFLAFTAGTEMSDEEARRTGVKAYLAAKRATPETDDEPEKQARPAPNKMASRPSDKTAAPEDKPAGSRSAPKSGEG